MFSSSWKWICVYAECRLLEAMRDSQSLGCRNLASHMKAEFPISLQFFTEKSRLKKRLRLRWVRSRLYWASSHVHCKPVWRGQWLRSHRFENRRGLSRRWKLTGVEKMRVKKNRWAAGSVCAWVWRKSWHELHLSVVIKRISRVWFCDVRKWTELPQQTGPWCVSQVTAGVQPCTERATH